MSESDRETKSRTGRGTLATFAAGVLLGLLVLAGLIVASPKKHSLAEPEKTPVAMAPAPDAQKAPATEHTPASQADLHESRRTAIVEAAERVGPSVVTLSVVQTRVVQTSPVPFGSDFFEPFFRDMIPQYRYREQIPSMGSGFIISKDGYVLTNEHVVQGATKITVVLADGRSFAGKLVGAHREYDLAIVKIEGKNLPAAPLGSSTDLLVGEWAIAIGNPFGFLLNDTQPTVTAGVVSATRRDIKATAQSAGIYKNMIQTDAAINPGNSGGPLVNARGEVIGVNTFIFTKSGGSEGIGFAIPIDATRRVVDEIIKYGKVRNVWIGVSTWELTPYIAERLQTADRNGLYVAAVERRSPADKAGVKVGDIIRKVNGTPVRDGNEAYRVIFGASVGDTIALTMERDGKMQTVRLLLEESPEG